jgi:uncharacterized protein (DUF427 family)
MLNRLRIFNKTDTNHRTYRAVAGDVVVAESADTQQLEGNQYFPPDSIDWDHFERSDRTSVCPWKGVASYYDVVVDAQRYPAAAWTYETPSAAAESIKDHVAFWHGVKVLRD